MLQKFLFIPLDIFKKIQHNKTISSKLDAWLLFFSSDDPEDIIQLINEYPEFQAMYEQAYQMCRNVENVMGIFSEELRILDRNTVQLMIDEMQDVINAQQGKLAESQATINAQQSTIDSQQGKLAESQATINAQQSTIDELKRQLEELRNKS